MQTELESKPIINKTVPSLNTLYFYLTEGCNLACRHCWIAPKLDQTGSQYPSLPIELFETAINEAKPLGLKGVKLTGGEPLMHPNFVDLLKIIRNENLGLTIETNGVLCSKEYALEISKSKNPFVSVSIDGIDAQTHEWVRGIAGSFEATKEGVRNLVSAGIRPQIILSIMHKNFNQVEEFINMAEELGSGSVEFNVVMPTARGEKMHESSDTLDIKELIDLGRYVEKELSKKTKMKLFYHYPVAFRSLNMISIGEGCGICGIFGILGVMADGHYALCGIGNNVPDLVFGKAGEDSLEKVWNEHPVLKELRENLPHNLEGICGRCLMKHRCMGSCIAQNYYSESRLMAPFWFCKKAEEAGIFPVSRLTTA